MGKGGRICTFVSPLPAINNVSIHVAHLLCPVRNRASAEQHRMQHEPACNTPQTSTTTGQGGLVAANEVRSPGSKCELNKLVQQSESTDWMKRILAGHAVSGSCRPHSWENASGVEMQRFWAKTGSRASAIRAKMFGGTWYAARMIIPRWRCEDDRSAARHS